MRSRLFFKELFHVSKANDYYTPYPRVPTSVGLGSSILTASTDSGVFPGRPIITTRYDGVMLRHAWWPGKHCACQWSL